MLRTASVSQLRSDLSSYLEQVEDGPIIVLSRSQPTAVLLDPGVYEALIESAETLEDILDGRVALEQYTTHPEAAVDAEEVFSRLGL